LRDAESYGGARLKLLIRRDGRAGSIRAGELPLLAKKAMLGRLPCDLRALDQLSSAVTESTVSSLPAFHTATADPPAAVPARGGECGRRPADRFVRSRRPVSHLNVIYDDDIRASGPG
jgi:hypothetical protein